MIMQAVFFGLQGHLFSDAPRPAGLRMPQIQWPDLLYWAVVALSATRWMDAVCTVVAVGLFSMDFSINFARDGRQTQMESFSEA
jgi:hypothetical protein